MLLPKQSRIAMTGVTVVCSLLLVACSPKETVQLNVIPLPAQVSASGGFLKVDSAAVFSTAKPANVRFIVDESIGGNPEGYQLVVNEKGIDLKAATGTGLFYGEQTLRQLFSPQGVPYVTIQDEPRFKYRGMHLDVSRHFFPKEEVFKLLDVI